MAQTYRQLQEQIQSLQRKADELRSKEIGGVIGRIKEAIAEYGLTAEQLGLSGVKPNRSVKSVVKGKSAVKGTRAAGAKYSDGHGNTWGGMGPRPRWLKDALAAGKSLNDFAGGAAASESASASASTAAPTTASGKPAKAAKAVKAGKAAKATKRRAKAAYADKATGSTWSGMGPRPRWLKEALASGKQLSDFAA